MPPRSTPSASSRIGISPPHISPPCVGIVGKDRYGSIAGMIATFRLVLTLTLASALMPHASMDAATVVAFDNVAPDVTGEGSIAYRGDTASVVSFNTVSGFGLNAMTGGNPRS